jgi:proteasome lid subunit RPN8/RPN11
MTSPQDLNITLTQAQADQIIAHARAANPNECCGLVGGTADGVADHVYPLRNIAANPRVTYEAAPEDLFKAQCAMRERGEHLLAIYHSHPRAADPHPSETDTRLAYYPTAVYLIVGLGKTEPCLKAFRIYEKEGRWRPAPLSILPEFGAKP